MINITCDSCKKVVPNNEEMKIIFNNSTGSKKFYEILKENNIIDVCSTCWIKHFNSYISAIEKIIWEAQGKVWLSEEERDIRIAEAIKEAEKQGHFDTFAGQNCDSCSGWTVGSHRCDCDNRRIYWANNQNDDGTFDVWPEAY